MSIGSSGRIVIEIEPETKRELYAALLSDGQTLKQWFLQQAEEYVRTGRQMPMFDKYLNPNSVRQDADLKA